VLRRAVTFIFFGVAAMLLLAQSQAMASTLTAAVQRPFAPDSIWNLSLRPDAPLDPNSSNYINWLDSQVSQFGTWINSSGCNAPIYVAAPGTPTVQVTISASGYQDQALLRAWSAVPMPGAAVSSSCTDASFAVEQQQPDGSIKEWEFYDASQQPNGSWTAQWGGVINNILTDRGVASPVAWTDPSNPGAPGFTSESMWNVTGSSESLIAGVITSADLQSGSIDHAVAMAIPYTAQGVWKWPAQRTDGVSTDEWALPEGAHLRLNPNLDLADIPMSPLVRMIAEAAQKYGVVLQNQTWSDTIFVTQQLTTNQQQSLVTDQLGGESPGQALAAFPWSQLELLQAPTCSAYGAPCTVTDSVTIDSDTPEPTVGQPITLDTTNSTLNYPRTNVQWDLNDSGSFSLDAGTDVAETFTPQSAGVQTERVKITTEDGAVTTGAITLDVQSATAVGSGAAADSGGGSSAPTAPISPPDGAPSGATLPSGTTGTTGTGEPTSVPVTEDNGRSCEIAGLRLRRIDGRRFALSANLVGSPTQVCKVRLQRLDGGRWKSQPGRTVHGISAVRYTVRSPSGTPSYVRLQVSQVGGSASMEADWVTARGSLRRA
jgi:hypothetical protein